MPWGILRGFHLTPGQAHDLDGFYALIEGGEADNFLADKAYDADERVRDVLRDKGYGAVIPSKKNRVSPIEYDKDLYKSRHFIENCFAKLKQYRAIATGYDKTSQNFLGAVYMASIVIWLN